MRAAHEIHLKLERMGFILEMGQRNQEHGVAEILTFIRRGPETAGASSAALASLRRSIGQLTDAVAALERSRDNLAHHHDALGCVKDELLVQVDQAHAIAALADAIEHAIATDDQPALAALQARLRALLDGFVPHRGARALVSDAAD
jgi:hypothetical protein